MVLEIFLPTFTDLIKDPINNYFFLPVKRHISYAFSCDSNIKRLQDQAERLKNRRDRLRNSVDDATRNGEEIYENVARWLIKAEEATAEADEIILGEEEAKKRCFTGLCPNLKTRYQLNKKADKKASAIYKLWNEEGLYSVSHLPPLKQKVAPSVYNREALQSRMSILKEIMDALKDPALRMIGIYGMGGVGKTTLAKEVHRQAQADRLFDVVILVAVSQTPDIRRIQAEIAEVLGLNLTEDGMLLRANRLNDRLKQEKILIILDDIWNQLQLEDIGIPSGDDCKECKILLTSRRLDVLHREMGTQKDFAVEVLSEEDAWKLFKKTLDSAPNSELPDMQNKAIEVARRCAGLPLLIIIVATQLRDNGSHAWEDMLTRLSLFGDGEIQNRVHSVLEESYKNLPSDELKSFFLLCGLFGQSNIQIKCLIMYSIGLGLFKRRATIKETRSRVFTFIKNLIAESLLLDGDMDGFVKMHDVVRDAAVNIASREQHAFIGSSSFEQNDKPGSCTRISLLYNDIHELPDILECPKAELLLLITEDLSLKIPNSFFERTGELKVLDFTGIRFKALPSSLALLANLRTLCLHQGQLDDAAIIGELRQLQVLSFANSYIAELAVQIQQLTRLKLLDLSNCCKLKVIPANVLSRLSSLEELYMRNSFVEWEFEGTNNEGNARISELEHLSHLSTLEMQVLDASIMPESLFFKISAMQNYRIVIGDVWDWSVNNESSRTLKLKLKTDIYPERGVLEFLKKTEDLHLDGVRGYNNVLSYLDKDGFPQLKHLHVLNDLVIQHVIDATALSSNLVFPALESLVLDHLMNLEDIHHGQLVADCFSRLQVLKVNNCEKLTALFSLYCDDLEHNVNVEIEDKDNDGQVVELAQLHSLILDNLPQLRSVCSKKKHPPETLYQMGHKQSTTLEESAQEAPFSLFNGLVSFPNLEDLRITSLCCERIWQDNFSGRTSNLTSLFVGRCSNLKFLFTTSIVRNLLHLKKLEIWNCPSMEEIILTKEFVEERERTTKIVFPKLDTVRLVDLPNLMRFCSRHPIEFELLRVLYIKKCPALTTFVSIAPPPTEMMGSAEAQHVNSEANHNFKLQSLIDEMVVISNLEEMHLEFLDNLKYIWQSELAPGAFCKLKFLKISDCPNLITVFPLNNLPRFQRLEKLYLHKCYSLQDIFQLQRLKVEGINDVAAFKLRELELSGLIKLNFIWSKDPHSVFTFQELQLISVQYCKSLKYIFPASIGRGLLQLKSLSVSYCGVEEIIAKADGVSLDPNFKFPQLTYLSLDNLREIKSFYPDKHIAEWLKLKCLNVSGCNNNSLFFVGKLNPNLEELTLDPKDLMRIQLGQFPVDCLFRLKVLKLEFLRDNSCIFLFDFLKKLHNLEKLHVSQAYLEEFYSDESTAGEMENSSTLVPVKHLDITLALNLKQIWKQVARFNSIISSMHVETLEIRYCGSLTSIVHSSSSFKNLANLVVTCCGMLKSLITVSTAKTMMQLTKMTISFCEMMTDVVEDVADHTEDEIIFSKLKILELQNLPNLTSFCSGNHAFNFPVLEEVLVYACPRMEIFCHGALKTQKLRAVRLHIYSDKEFWDGNLNATIANLDIEEFKSRDYFQLSEHPEFRKNWNDQLLGSRFHNVESLVIDKCASFTKALSVNLLQFLNKLRKLEVRDCQSVEEVFDLEEVSTNHGNVGLLPRLNKLQLIDLPMLRHLWNKDPNGILYFKNLKFLDICNCNRLKYAFSVPMVSCLVQLQEVQLRKCEMMEAIIKENEVEKEISSKIIFPSLNSIVLEYLPNFSSFCLGSENLECLTLKKFSIYDCPKLKPSFSKKQRSKTNDRLVQRFGKGGLGFQNTQLFGVSLKVISNLEELSLDCKSTQTILQCGLALEFLSKVKVVEMRFFPPKSCSSLFNFLQMLPNLEKLVVNSSSLYELFLPNGGLVAMRRSCENLIYLAPPFSNLTTLEVCHCNKLTRGVPLSVAKTLVQLVNLSVKSCNILMEIVGGEQDTGLDEIVFSKMKKLELVDLHSLRSFCLNSCTFEFPSLENVVIQWCPDLSIFCAGVLRTPKLDGVKLSIFNTGLHWEGDLNATIQKLHMNMDGYKTLFEFRLSKFATLEEKWCGQFPFKNFNTMYKLVVDECASFSNIIPLDLLQHLNWLKVLVVEKCDSLEEMFNLESPNAHEDDDVRMKLLSELHLIDLPRLRHVWNKSTQGILSFENLRFLKVQNCASLTHIFTLSMALGLGKLKHIEVASCAFVEHIVFIEDDKEVLDKTIFPSLVSMSLECLPSLSSFYSDNDVLKCPSLKRLDLVGCPKLNIFSSAFSKKEDSSMIVEAKAETILKDILVSPLFSDKFAIPSLENLSVEWNTVKKVWHELQAKFFCRLKALTFKCCPGEFPLSAFSFLEKVPNLEIKLVVKDTFSREMTFNELDINEEKYFASLPQLKVLVSSPVSFRNVTTLEVCKCHGLVNLVNATAARNLVQLIRMDIHDCEMMQEIVVPEADGGDDDEIKFSQVRFLKIQGLPSLTSFCSGNITLNFPSLEEVIVRECPNMKTFGKQVMTTPKLWKVQTGEEAYEWEWEGSLNDTIAALFMEQACNHHLHYDHCTPHNI